LVAVALAVLPGGAPPARAQAPADTTLGHFLGKMSDSTDAYFGVAAQRPDCGRPR
jgi:hypothetical protein